MEPIRGEQMVNVTRFVIWICKKFDREHVTMIVEELKKVLADPYAGIKPKDTFREDHPEYRNFVVDPEPPFREPQKKKNKKTSKRS
jgi:hypothetical protein